MRLMIIGHAGHGKDTVCNILQTVYDLKFVSSSYFVAERHVRDYLAVVHGLVYNSLEACYIDRVNHRDKWHNAIVDFCIDDPARMGRELFGKYDIYCGLRSRVELNAMIEEKLFDWIWWVDRGLILPSEPKSSMKLTMDDANFILDNNGTKEFLATQVMGLYKLCSLYTAAKTR